MPDLSESVHLALADAEDLVARALVASGTSPANARSVARALVQAEADGQSGHGLSRVPSYAAQSLIGKVDGHAVAVVETVSPAAIVIDAGFGFAFPAIDLAVETLPALVRSQGIAVAAIRQSHHFGQAGATVERLAKVGLISLMFGNTPKAMALWGGRKARIGTNPIAFAAPLPGPDPLVIDLALSEVARGKIVAAEKAGKSIPVGWAIDAYGEATEDPTEALKGSMLPAGGVKGFALALMVEILAAALTGSHFGFEASSVLDDKGPAPDLGQTLLAIEPDLLSGGQFLHRMSDLLAIFGVEDGTRLPGQRRLSNRAEAERHGLRVSAPLYREIFTLAEKGEG